ncbi:hypothetical protein F2Q69_00035119 [Brassica cretica]|uniref:Uncharacterized protein n=1 Tax=Brassica cretica TaxID=69181 RepID=A0A8S9SU25_BRACR|nr:hypothetical protein F2Q69_00035119 [Brassica cretica]
MSGLATHVILSYIRMRRMRVVVICTESVVCGLASHTSLGDSHVAHPSFFPLQHAGLERGGDGCYNLVSERSSVPALTRDGDLWDSDFNGKHFCTTYELREYREELLYYVAIVCVEIVGRTGKHFCTTHELREYGEALLYYVALCKRRMWEYREALQYYTYFCALGAVFVSC